MRAGKRIGYGFMASAGRAGAAAFLRAGVTGGEISLDGV